MDGCGDGILSLGFFIKNRLHECLINLIIYWLPADSLVNELSVAPVCTCVY